MTTNEQEVDVKLLKYNEKKSQTYNDIETITLDTNDAENNNSNAQHRKK